MIPILHDPRVWSAFAFVIFFVLFGKKMWHAVVSRLDARSQAIRTDLKEAARLRKEAEKLIENARLRNKQAQNDAKQLIARSQKEAEVLTRQTQADLKAQAENQERLAQREMDAMRDKAIANFKAEAVELAVAAAREYIAHELNAHPAQERAVLDGAVKDLRRLVGKAS